MIWIAFRHRMFLTFTLFPTWFSLMVSLLLLWPTQFQSQWQKFLPASTATQWMPIKSFLHRWAKSTALLHSQVIYCLCMWSFHLQFQGGSNFVGSFFNCGPIAASLSRSLIQEQVWWKTIDMICSLAFSLEFQDIKISDFTDGRKNTTSQFVFLLSAPHCSPLDCSLLWTAAESMFIRNGRKMNWICWVKYIKCDFNTQCVLSSIIVVALKGMFLQFKDLKKAWLVSKLNAFVWLATFLSTVVLDIEYGLMVGFALAVLTLLWRSSKAYVSPAYNWI